MYRLVSKIWLNSIHQEDGAIKVTEGLKLNPSVTFIFDNLSYDNTRVLDLTDPAIAKKWGYNGGDITPETKAIGTKAMESGFNMIKILFSSW